MHTTQNASAVTYASGISSRHAGALALPAALGSARNRPAIRLRGLRLRRTGREALVLGVLRTDEGRQRESFRDAHCVHRHEAVDPGFAAGIESDPIKAVTYSAPVCAKEPVQPKCGSGRSLSIRQLDRLSSRGGDGNVGEVQIIK